MNTKEHKTTAGNGSNEWIIPLVKKENSRCLHIPYSQMSVVCRFMIPMVVCLLRAK